MIAGVEIFCFAASYTVAFALEVTRLFFRATIRTFVAIGFAAAGLLAHTLYLTSEARRAIETSGEAPLSSWRHWCLLAAWVLVATFLGMAITRPKNALGVFVLPLVLVLIAVAWWFPGIETPFPRDQAYRYWQVVHGMALLLGTAVVMLGFVAGVMYLVQSYRLKHKWAPRQGLQLPSLEWLQRMNEDSFVLSSCLLAAGLISGVVLNFIRRANDVGGLPWTDPVVWTSGVLFLWLVAASVFNLAYRPARQGRKVAYLTVASFIFLGFALGAVLFSPTDHASPRRDEDGLVQVQEFALLMEQGGWRRSLRRPSSVEEALGRRLGSAASHPLNEGFAETALKRKYYDRAAADVRPGGAA